MYSTITSCAVVGVEPKPIRIEASLSGGKSIFIIVGLPDAAVRESRERVRSAMKQQGFRFPRGRIVINLSPADLPKVGATYDLPIALSLIAAASETPIDFAAFVSVGELSLDGQVRPVRAALGATMVAEQEEKTCMLSSLTRIRITDGVSVVGIESLRDAVAVAEGRSSGAAISHVSQVVPKQPDLSTVRGQVQTRRALEISAAGGHHLLLSGSPGAGKTLMARCMPSILPMLSEAQEREVAMIWATAGIDRPAVLVPPFRSPHHSSTLPAMVGGGSGVPRPGEVSKAHHGVLFLDELGEFVPSTLDALRQPIEDGVVTVARSAETISFPARIQVIAATNPCPCGFHGDSRRPCTCSENRKDRYRQRLSGPLLDRFDLRVRVHRMRPKDLQGPFGESSTEVRSRVCAARAVQETRGVLNARLSGRALDEMQMTGNAQRRLAVAAESDEFTGRGWDRVRRVARTIADLDMSVTVRSKHVEEAIDFREPAT